jgi:ABC-type nitrate/sulfonate/bicarbonate transport system ATPase subunit
MIIEKVSLKVPAGKIVVLLGPSGCGKSTILRAVAGLLKPTKGMLFFDGTEISGPGSDRCIVFQNYACFPFLTVEENVAFGLVIKGSTNVEKPCEALLRAVGLSHLRKHYPSTLSGGERQRVAIARSLAVNPKLLLMDEPFSSLDGNMRRHLQDLLLHLCERKGLTCLFVTHSVEEAVYLGSIIYVMSAGPTETKASPATILGQIFVDFAQPRTQGIKTESKFEEVERQVNELLRKRAYASN